MSFTPVGVEFIAKGLNKYLTDLGKADKAQGNLGKSAEAVGKGFAGLGKSVLSVGALAAGAALAGVGALAAGTVALGVAATSTAISFESAFTGVTKTIDGLSDTMGNLTALGQQIRGEFEQLSTVVPATFEEIAAIGEIGGQLGVGASSITDFTETVVQLRDTTTLTAEEAATDLARLGNIYQISTNQMGQNTIQLGSALVALGNNFAANEGQILNFATRIAGAGQVVGLTQADILGIGTAFSAVGVEAEAGGTAVQKVLIDINNAVNAGASGFVDYTEEIDRNVAKMRDLQATSARLEAQAPGLQQQILAQYDAFIAAGGSADEFGRQLGDKTIKAAFDTALAIRDLGTETELLRSQQGQPIDSGQLARFAQVAGVSADEFKMAWQQDAAGAFEMFVEGLGREGDNAANVLDELGLADQRLVRGFLSLAGAGDLLERTMQTANDAFEEGTALQEEAQKRYATTASKIQMLKNTFRVFLAQIGSSFLPIFNQLIQSATDFIKKWAEPVQKAVEKVSGAFQRFGIRGAAISILGQLGLEPDEIAGVLSTVDGIIASVTDAFGKISTSFAAFGVTGAAGTIMGMLGLDPETIVTVISVVDTIITTIQNLGSQIVSILGQISFNELLGALTGIGAVIAGGVFVAIVAGLISILTPINLIIAAAALLGAAWAGNWFGIQETTASVIAFISNLFTTLSGLFMSTVAGPLSQAFGNITVALGNLGLTWGDVWSALGQATMIVGAVIGVVILGIISLVVGFISAFANAFAAASTFFPTIATGIMTVLTGIGTAVAGAVALVQNLIAGNWTAAWQSFLAIVQGINAITIGIFQTMAGVIGAALGVIIGYIVGFAEGVTTTFTNLFNALVGNSIVTDGVQMIIDAFVNMVGPILDALGPLVEGVGAIFSSIFGGGDSGGGMALDFDPAAMLDGLNQVQAVMTQINAQFLLMAETMIPALLAMAMAAFPQIQALWTMLNMLVTQHNFLILALSTVLFPQLLAIATSTLQSIIAGFTSLNAIIQQTITLIMQLIAAFIQLGATAPAIASSVASAMQKIADNTRKAVSNVKTLIEYFNRLEAAAIRAANAISRVRGNASSAGAAQGMGFRGGLGFQGGFGANTNGVLGLGYKVPAGFPNDSFGPFYAQSDEEMLITPRGTSIEGLVFDRLAQAIGDMRGGNQTEINMPIYTAASPQSIVQQLQVIKSLID